MKLLHTRLINEGIFHYYFCLGGCSTYLISADIYVHQIVYWYIMHLIVPLGCSGRLLDFVHLTSFNKMKIKKSQRPALKNCQWRKETNGPHSTAREDSLVYLTLKASIGIPYMLRVTWPQRLLHFLHGPAR